MRMLVYITCPFRVLKNSERNGTQQIKIVLNCISSADFLFGLYNTQAQNKQNFCKAAAGQYFFTSGQKY